ncbi:hypothetical protein FOZ63_032994 [Perkinsus olseni]|uniref:Uncharacterized protein n=1 Tax=Perkinsus olseni TaxID=32597 RepID=A0A7J6SSH8_PEROL|nr:hypothetical protein FOZ63_032994 [Perkinsus olseni]
MQRESYCMFYKLGAGTVCHESDPPIPCGPANTTSLPTPPLPGVDKCALLNPTGGRTVPERFDDSEPDLIWGKAEDVSRCLYSLRMTRFDALFTLHNLRYGLTENYAFTDIANGLNESIQSNTCGFKLHSLDVDIRGFIDGKIKEFADVLEPMTLAERKKFLSESIPAAPFHFALQREISRLNDAHTRYDAPYRAFFYELPIRFNSYMRSGAQVVTLGSVDLGDFYTAVYGTPVTQHQQGDIIVQVDGKPVLEWMQDMVSERGPYLGLYQGPLQRLNRHFFVSPILARDPLFYNPPTGPLAITFEDGLTDTIHWLGSVDDYSKLVGEGAITARFYNALTNRNPLFQRTVKFETEFYKKESETLWGLGGEDLFTADFDTQVLDDILRPKPASRRRGVSFSESACK